MSNNVGITQLAANQASPEVTVNNALGRIDAAVTELLTANMTSGNVTPTLAQLQQALQVQCTNATVAGRQLILTNLNVKKMLAVESAASSTQPIAIVKGSTTVMLQPGEQLLLYLDGTANFLQAYGRGKRSQVFHAGDMVARITNGAARVTTELATNDVMVDSFDFDQTTSEGVQFSWWPEKAWDRGTVTAIFSWTAAAGAGTVSFTLAGLARSNDDALDTAFGTAQTATDTLLATDDEHHSPETPAVTIGGTPAEDDRVIFQVTRDVSDTLNADAKLIAVKLIYGITTPSQR